MSERVGWFADIVSGAELPVPEFPWQPVMQCAGSCLSLDIWFSSRLDCEDFIRSEILGLGMIDD